MSGDQLCSLGGILRAVKGGGGRNAAWVAETPEGFRFTDGRHTVRREMDQTWEDVMGHLSLEVCGPGCACHDDPREEEHHCSNPNCCGGSQ